MKHKAPSCCFVKQTVQKTAVWKQNVSFLLSKCSRLLFTSAQIFFKRHHRHRVQRAVQTFRSACIKPRHGQFVSQPRCYARVLYVEDLCPRGRQGRGATISCEWWLFCLGCHPRRRGERGQDGGSQESKICCTAQRTSVWWSGAEWAVVLVKNKRESAFHFVSIGDRLNITQAVCGYPGDGQWWPLMSLPSDRADGGVDVRVALTKRPTRLFFKVLRWVMFSRAHYEETVGLNILLFVQS